MMPAGAPPFLPSFSDKTSGNQGARLKFAIPLCPACIGNAILHPEKQAKQNKKT
jgi:hypothetical protein